MRILRLSRRGSNLHCPTRLSALLPALAALLLAACATLTNPVTGRDERTVMDESTELAEGRKAHEQVLQQYGVYDNPALQTYVTTLGRKLAAQSHRSQLDWHFTVLDSTDVNAFALPGGYVYVTRGIMAYMESEADLAGVMGHEIGHVTARHGAQRATREKTAGIGVLAASVLGAVLGVGDLASQLSQGVAAGYVASYSREQESQADKLGAEYLSRTHYDPKNMIDVIKVLKSQERFAADEAREAGRAAPQASSWLSSHPSNDKRLQDIQQIAQGYSGQYDDDGRARYLQAINGMGFGESRSQGVTRGRNFFHEPLGIALTAPLGWQVGNEQDAITLANAEGDAGLIVQLVPEKAGGTHEEILRNLFKLTQGKFEALQLNGLQATHVIGTRIVSKGQLQNFEATVVSGPEGKNFAMLYAGKDGAALQRSRSALKEAESSFRALTAADRKAAKPWALKTLTFPAGGFAALAKQSPLPDHAEQQLRLLNGAYGAERDPAVGQLVKVVE